MPFVPANNVVLVEMIQTLASQSCENTIYMQGAQAWSLSDMESLASEMRVWWVNNMAPLLAGDTVLNKIRVTDLTSQSAPSIEYSTLLPVNASDASGSVTLPNNVTLVVKFVTQQRGRSYRGRNYLVGIRNGRLSGPNTVTSAYAQSVVNAYGQLQVLVFTNTASHVIVSRMANGQWRQAAAVTDVSAYTVNLNLDSQRRRLPERGM